jgi:KaiC/GvpD/RAD55 family RecA-like ATPase
MSKQVDTAEATKALALILEPGQVTELRSLFATTNGKHWVHTESGYFSEIDRLIQSANTIDTAKGIYFIPNLINPALLARACNRIRPCDKHTALTSDNDVTKRRWLLVDCDSVHPADISATDEEHKAALLRADTIMRKLQAEGWPWPIMADSGNGAHLLYRIDEPADDSGLVQRCIEALATRFDDAAVKVDRKVFNPARIWKLYGTWACKGDDVPDRPHRLSKIKWAPASLETVSHALLLALGGEAKPVSKPKPSAGLATFDVPAFIARHALKVGDPKPYEGGQRWEFDECPWNSDHKGSAFLIQFGSGAISAGCHHNSCSGHNWSQLREMYEPKPPPREREEPPIGEPPSWASETEQKTTPDDRCPGSDDDAPPKTIDRLRPIGQAEALAMWKASKLRQAVPTGITDLDAAIGGGLPVGQVTTVLGYTGVGKSEFARQIRRRAASAGHPVIHVDVELGAGRILERDLAQATGIPAGVLRSGQLSQDEDKRAADGEAQISAQTNIVTISPGCGVSTTALETAISNAMSMIANEKPALLIIDSLQRLSLGADGETLRVQMMNFNAWVEAFARENNVAVLVTSEQRRTQDGKIPSVADILTSGAESRSIEFGCDVLLGLVPKTKIEDQIAGHCDEEREREIELVIAKNRNGGPGYCQSSLVFQAPCWGMRIETRGTASIEVAVLAELGTSEQTALSASDISKKSHRRKEAVLEGLNKLLGRCLVKQTGSGRMTKWYRIDASFRFPNPEPKENSLRFPNDGNRGNRKPETSECNKELSVPEVFSPIKNLSVPVVGLCNKPHPEPEAEPRPEPKRDLGQEIVRPTDEDDDQ